jgi:hypothetical protein
MLDELVVVKLKVASHVEEVLSSGNCDIDPFWFRQEPDITFGIGSHQTENNDWGLLALDGIHITDWNVLFNKNIPNVGVFMPLSVGVNISEDLPESHYLPEAWKLTSSGLRTWLEFGCWWGER